MDVTLEVRRTKEVHNITEIHYETRWAFSGEFPSLREEIQVFVDSNGDQLDIQEGDLINLALPYIAGVEWESFRSMNNDVPYTVKDVRRMGFKTLVIA